ncbi:MAG: HAD hydrolase-like protein [Rhodothermaceae bacterium]|nr:HAD hydrolase-like protein [Rhodothermaceae bacterium]
MKLFLFDIDGTLLDTHGLGRQAAEAALQTVFGQPISSAGLSFSGKTDTLIFRELLDRAREDGHAFEDFEATHTATLDAYQEEMHARAATARVEALPGAVALVERLAQNEAALGLVTGNLQPMAYLKLQPLGLDGFFPVGGFGSDNEDRNRLPALAAQRAEDHHRRPFVGREVVVIGDTPRDIECARAFGATAVAVATGRFDRDALAPHKPDVLLDTLEETKALLGSLA